MKIIGLIASILVLVGALNWGFVGLFDMDLVAEFFGRSMAAKVICDLIGISAFLAILGYVRK